MNHTNRNLRHLVVIRISDSSAIKDLDKKTVETADLHRGIPGADMLRKLRGTPLRDPSSVGGRLATGPGFRACHFRLPGTSTDVLMALGSATAANLGEDDNAFVTMLSEVLAETPVNSIWVADFSRLLRSVDYLSPTWRAIRDHCEFVRHAGAVIDTASPTAEVQFLFEALSSAADARSVVQRTTRGKMRAYVDGRCPLHGQSVPLGWLRDEDRRLQLDPDLPQEVVRTIVQVLGDSGLTNRERVRRVAAAGGASQQRTDRLGRRVALDQLSNPSETVARWYELLDVWQGGSWVVDYHLPALLNQTHFDFDVTIRPTNRGTRVWLMSFDLPMPEGGWATDDEFEAAARRRDRRAQRATPQGGASPGAARKPFCGMPGWLHDGDEYKLLSRRSGLYELRRRPADRATRIETIDGARRHVANGWGRGPDKDGVVVAVLSTTELHHAVTHGLVDAATSGLTLRTAADQLLRQDDSVVADLKDGLRRCRTAERNARRSANEALSDHERRSYQQDAREAGDKAQELERDLLAFAGPLDRGQLQVDSETVATVLASVAGESDHVPGPTADAFREVVTDLRIVPVDDTTARWSASLRVPLVGGVMTLGPATGLVDIGPGRSLAARRKGSLAERAEEATRLFMRDGLSVAEVSDELGITTTRRVAQTIRDHLKAVGASPAAASVLLSSTPWCGRRVVWARLLGLPYPRDVPQAYAVHVEAAYLDRDVRRDPNFELAARLPRAAVEATRQTGGWVPGDQLADLASRAGISRTTLDYYVDGRERNGVLVPAYLRRVDGGVGLVPCPHGCKDGWATHVSMLPEVTRELLCPTCRRMPDLELADVIFPIEYFTAG